MVLKFETDQREVYFVDATSNRGVSISKWSSVRPYIGEFYEHIILRHLDFSRDDEMIDKLEVFLKEAVGLKYGIGKKLLFSRPSIKPNKGQFIDEDRTFFCSELVAKAYKILGISVDDRASNAFFPSHFSSKGDIKLVKGA